MSEQFTRACSVAETETGEPVAVELDGVEVAVVRDGEDLYAVHDECSHESIPLSEGDVEDGEIECWLHGSRFDLHTGKPTSLPATDPVPLYPLKVVGDDVLVDVHHPLNSAPDTAAGST